MLGLGLGFLVLGFGVLDFGVQSLWASGFLGFRISGLAASGGFLVLRRNYMLHCY